jgi:hypothetical protein
MNVLTLRKAKLLQLILKPLLIEATAVLDSIPNAIMDPYGKANRLRLEYQKVRSRFQARVTEAVDGLEGQVISRRDFNRRMYGYFESFYVRAYELGKEITSGSILLNETDKAYLDKEVMDEFGYSRVFANDILIGAGDMDYRARALLYVKALDSLFYRGQVSGMPRGLLVEWHCDPTVKNCQDCIEREAGSPYTADTLPGYPRDGTCMCITACRCSLQLSF